MDNNCSQLANLLRCFTVERDVGAGGGGQSVNLGEGCFLVIIITIRCERKSKIDLILTEKQDFARNWTRSGFGTCTHTF